MLLLTYRNAIAMKKRFFPLLMELIVLQLFLSGQNVYTPLQNSEFRRIMLSDGLAGSVIYSFLQDRTGNMWIGTGNGLNRYDGYRMHTYKHLKNEAISLSNSRINSIFETKNGDLYIGTDKGLNLYDPESDSFTLLSFTSSYSIKFLLETHTGALWIGTNMGAICYTPQTGNRKHYYQGAKTDSLPGNYISCGITDDEETLYIGTTYYICKKSPGEESFVSMTLPAPTPGRE
ncbi:hypothetical protein EZS27_027361, partial [termite gut metagenome]